MKKILKYGFGCLMFATLSPTMISCTDDDISSNVTEVIYPTYVSLEVPAELQGYIYTDATGTKVLPMLKGNTAALQYSMSDDATYRDIAWESSNTNVATIDDSGLVTAISGAETGYSIITVHPAVYFSGSGIAGTLKVLVADELVPASSVTINYEERDEYYEGDILQLKFVLSPETSTYKTVKWSTSDNEIATVDLDGKVSFLKRGEVTITATSMDGRVSDSITFNVLSGTAPSSISFINMEALQHLAYGQKINLKEHVKMEPEYATFSMIDWSDADGLISVDGNGIMTIKYTGTTAVMKMIGHTIELVASDRNGNKLGATEVTTDGGHLLHNFSDGLAPFAMSWRDGTTYGQHDKYVHFDVSTSGRQDITLASTNGVGGYYLSTAKYKYFAMKMRRPYYYDEENGYSSCKPGTPDGWRYNKLALNITPTTVANLGHQNFSKELDMSGSTPSLVDVKWDGQPKVYVYELNHATLLGGTDSATGLVDIKNLDIIVADLTGVSEKTYDIYWIGTFDSLEAIKEYYDANEE